MHNLSIIVGIALLTIVTPACKNGGYSTGSSGLGFGNMYVEHHWSKDGHRPEEIDWVIICAEIPDSQSHKGRTGQLTVGFKDGTVHDFVPAKGSVTWLAPGIEPRNIQVDDLHIFVRRIEELQDEVVDVKFDSPESLIDRTTE